MTLKFNHIITLENNDKYVVLNNAILGGKKYYLSMGITNKKANPQNIKILEEFIRDEELYVQIIEDQKLVNTLLKIFASQNKSY